MTMPDILARDVEDAPGLAALAAAIRQHLSAEELRHFDADLERWNVRYSRAISDLAVSPEWQEIEPWRAYLLARAPKPNVP